MRLPIYKPEDFFGHPNDPLYLDVAGVTVEPELPLCYNYDHQRPPIGKAIDIQVDVEADTITCGLEFFETTDPFFHELVEKDGYLVLFSKEQNQIEMRYRLGGYYTVVRQVNRDGKKVVDQTILREVSLIPEEAWPVSEKEPAQI